MSWDWLTKSFARLPGCSDDLFRNLWLDRQLRFDEFEVSPNVIDEYCARLICAAISKKTCLLIGLTDYQPYRPALLFSTALIRYWWDSCYPYPSNRQPILYFGSTIGIREHLKRTVIRNERGWNLRMSEVFHQQDITRGNTYTASVYTNQSENKSNLPQVITVYSPSDPAEVLKHYNPRWIAIDYDDASQIGWLQPLLRQAKKQQIPMIAWGQNPLSECVTNFGEYGDTFIWPSQRNVSPSDIQIESNIESAFVSKHKTEIQPLILESTVVDQIVEAFKEANTLLLRGAHRSCGQLGNDALKIHWMLLRSLESLSVPFDFYEAEASQFWGMRSFEQLRSTCEHFRKVCFTTYRELAIDLEQANAFIEKVIGILRSASPPLWSTLCNLGIDEPPSEEARILIFPSSSKKQLFLLALLARYNISEDDLRALRIWVLNLSEMRGLLISHSSGDKLEGSANFPESSLTWRLLMVGLPSPYLNSKLFPTLLQDFIEILIYPHQRNSLVRRVKDWSQALTTNAHQMALALNRLTETPITQNLPQAEPRIKLNDSIKINAETIERVKQRQQEGPLWQQNDPVEEIARLLEADDEIIEEEYYFSTHEGRLDETSSFGAESLWCDEAIEVTLDQGWSVLFAPDDVINVIINASTGLIIDERYVRSLQVGSRVVLIHGQRRQNLYSLIISRMHSHPTMELHLALIRRWHDDFVVCYERWCQNDASRNFDILLNEMQARGSGIISSTTLNLWYKGIILSPLDPGDLYRLAGILSMDFVRQHYRRINQAAVRLRGLHRGLAIRLNRWLEQQASGLTDSNDSEIIDAELGLTFGDFKNSLMILRVIKVSSVKGPFLRGNLGRMGKDK